MMTPDFFRPDDLADALKLLAGIEDSKPLSGGASLVAMMNARIVEPRALVSITRIRELKGIRVVASGDIVIGAATRHCEIESERRLTGTLSIVSEAAAQIGNATIRNMGTIGGAVAHADPGLDFPPALVAAGASIEVASPNGRRLIAADALFVDWYATALEAGELVVAIHLPKAQPGVGVYLKHARVAGDLAIAAVALSKNRNGLVQVAVGGCGPTPIASAEADAILSSDPSERALSEAGELLASLADPIDDVRASAEYRLLLIPRMLRRAMHDAAAAIEGRP
jgi:CO/xanthine dehydrogenase FAD-binding subunit